MKRLVIAVLVAALTACRTATPSPSPASPATPATTTATSATATTPQCNAGHLILNATLWVQAAAEYRASALQTYANARRALDEALRDKSWVGAPEDDSADQPPAVIMDVDETALDNTPFQARVIGQGMSFDKAQFSQWVETAAAASVPGAAEFASYAHSRGVTLFYITNRDAPQEERGTAENLRKAGFPVRTDMDVVLLRGENGWASDKTSRRALVASKYRVLLVIGDDLNDFMNARDKSQREREELMGRHEQWWGSRWFMVPNPMYGSWENAAAGRGGTTCEEIERKMRALRSW